jgi:hypothetical protein
MRIIDPLVICFNSHPKAPTCPSTPEAKEHIPTPSFVVFNFGLTFEFYKEFGGALVLL